MLDFICFACNRFAIHRCQNAQIFHIPSAPSSQLPSFFWWFRLESLASWISCTDWMSYSENISFNNLAFAFCHYNFVGWCFAFAITWFLCLFYHCAYFLGIYRKDLHRVANRVTSCREWTCVRFDSHHQSSAWRFAQFLDRQTLAFLWLRGFPHETCAQGQSISP